VLIDLIMNPGGDSEHLRVPGTSSHGRCPRVSAFTFMRAF